MKLTGKALYAFLAGGLALVLLGAGIATALLSGNAAPVVPASSVAPAPPPEPIPEPESSAPVEDSAPSETPPSSGSPVSAAAESHVLALPPLPPSLPETAGETASSLPADGNTGLEAAKAAALRYTGLTDSQVTWVEVGSERKHGRLRYELEFWAGQMEYEYDISETGEVLKAKQEDHSIPAAAGDIGAPTAKAVAFAHAGVSESQITALYVEMEAEHGQVEYDIEFWVGQLEYDYTVNGGGAVTKCGWEVH